MGKKQKVRIDFQEGPADQNLLGDLFRSKGLIPAGKEAQEPSMADGVEGRPSAGQELSRIDRIVLQFEKKGHGGKRATRVEGLPFGQEALRELARELQREMGCGAWVEEGMILLQGDLTERLRDWFARKGAHRVVISGRGGSAG